MNYHILPFLGALEIFKLRGVSAWMREQVKKCWPRIFKREMYEQLLAKDLRKTSVTV